MPETHSRSLQCRMVLQKSFMLI